MRTFAFLFFLGVMLPSITTQAQNNRVSFNDQELFLSGGNVAWVNFAADIGPGDTRLDLFEEIFREVNESGGNTMRLWLHTNGTVSPAWEGNDVVGPGENTIQDLEAILDLAYHYDVSLMLCLWSFDMLQDGLSDTQINRNRGLLTDENRLQTYIDNALIPMVDSLKKHPAINAWEIFNEPEGMSTEFGWTPDRVDMSDIQWFINRTAGAIKRTAPDVAVTNGSWNIRASSDIFSSSNNKNYYSDEELIAAGGDEDGVLDYYTVHYYEHFPIQQSPFHNDYEHWELDKPLVIAEFYMSDPREDDDPDNTYGVHWEDYYTELYDRGYAGALGWQWFDTWAGRDNMDGVDGTLMWPRIRDNMETMADLYSEDVLLSYPGIRLNFDAERTEIEEGQEVLLTWNVRGAETVTLDGVSVAFEGKQNVSPLETTTYELAATDTAGNVDTARVTIKVLDPDEINRALLQPATASSVETEASGADDPAFAVDGDLNTRWSSAWDDDEWIYVDLGGTYDVDTVELHWEAAYGSVYNIDVSYDGVNWTTVFEEENGDGGLDSIALESPHSARFVRMHGLERASENEWGFSLWEMEVRGLISEQQAPTIVITSPPKNRIVETGSSITARAEAMDTDGDITRVSFFFGNDSLTTLTEAPYEISIDDIPEGDHQLYAKAEDSQGIVVQSQPRTITGSNDFTRIRYELEDALLSGNTSIESSVEGASGGAYVNIEDSGTLTFTNLGWPEASEYQLSIGYYLPFDYKEQFFLIEDDTLGSIPFGGSTEQWLRYDTTFTKVGGFDEFTISHSWGYMYLDYVEISAVGVSVSNERETGFPQALSLHQNYPNPFNPTTNISYELPGAGLTQLTVYNLLGQEVATLIDQHQRAGDHQVQWDASAVSSGVYILRLKTNAGIKTRKITLIK